MSNSPSQEEEQEENNNIETILRYLLEDWESPVPHPPNVILGPDVISGLGEHINTEGQGPFPSTSEGHQLVINPELTLLGIPNTSAQSPTFTNLHRSLEQCVIAGGMRHVLNPNVFWETNGR